MSTSGFGFLRRQSRNSAGTNATNNNNNNANEDSSSSASILSPPTDLSADSSAGGTHVTVQSNSNSRSGGKEGKEPDNILNSQYARTRRELLELVRELRTLGHDKDLDIPQIAVIGKQSAGKSSLVEAVAGINVPRDAGTCTRCPTECTLLTSSDKWSCSISLRGEGINAAFSPVLTSKDLVELWIRRAQAAVLCPHIDREKFKSMSREDIKHVTDHTINAEVKRFSKTVVEVKILDPDGTDLVFVDLPGLIQNEDDEVVSQLEDMVKQSISLPSTIILVTVPAEDDLDNQKALKLAREADPHGERTIAVVTKADKIGPGETGKQGSWRDIFQGTARDHKLRLGYYAVRLPTDEERAQKITAARVREEAARVFDTVAPWNDIKAFPGPTRLGVDALLRDISPLLMRMLIDAIPRLKTAVSHLLATCLAALARLPTRAETADSTSELIQLVFRFCEAVKATVDGTGDDKSFVHRSLAHYRALKAALRATAPDFRPFEDPYAYPRPPDPPSQRREDDFSAPMSVPVPMPVPVPVLESRPESPTPALSRSLTPSAPSECSRVDVPQAGGGDQEGSMMGLLDVRRVIKESTGWELPHNVPYLAKTRLIRTFVRRWSVPSKTCFERIRGLVEQHVYEALVSRHFAQFPSLRRFIVTQLRAHIEAYLARARVAVHQVLAREEQPYFTQNGHYLEATREVWLGHYKEVRRLRHGNSGSSIQVGRGAAVPGFPFMSPPPAGGGSSRAAAEAVAAITALPGYSDVGTGDLPKLLPTDEFVDELTVMADVRSYFQVAYKRVIDNVPQTIHHDFVQGFAYGLDAYLLGKLDLGAKDASARIEKLLEEDPEVSQTRNDLQEKKKRLEAMKVRLDNFRI